ncbi:MAG: DNA modification methyltransferase, partial [uncultured Thermomicrobiales bacterium]
AAPGRVGGQPRGARAAPVGDGAPGLRRPAVQYRARTVADGHAGASDRQRPRRAAGPRRPAPGDDPRGGGHLRRRLRRLSGVPRAAPAGSAPGAGRRRGALSPPRRTRGALCEDPPRSHLWPRLLHQRDHLGVRLRWPLPASLAGQARHDPLLREGPRPLPLRRRRRGPRAVHGAGAGHPRAARARQASQRRLVAHHRQPDRAREDRLPHPEAPRRAQADRRRLVTPGRRGARLLRGERDDRRGGAGARAAVPPRRRQPGGTGDDGPALRGGAGRGVRRLAAHRRPGRRPPGRRARRRPPPRRV